MMNIRFFMADDADDIVRMHSLSGIWFEEGKVTRDFIISAANRPDFRFFVAEDKDKTIGFCGTLYYESVGRAEVGPIAVDPEREGSGVGAKLVEHTIRFLVEKKIHRIVARVKEENMRAREFFAKNGFEFEARLKNFTKKGEDVLQYVRLP